MACPSWLRSNEILLLARQPRQVVRRDGKRAPELRDSSASRPDPKGMIKRHRPLSQLIV
jgi:hypothetical protein